MANRRLVTVQFAAGERLGAGTIARSVGVGERSAESHRSGRCRASIPANDARRKGQLPTFPGRTALCGAVESASASVGEPARQPEGREMG